MIKHLLPLSFSAGLVVGALLAAAWFSGGAAEFSPVVSPEEQGGAKNESLSSDLLSVNDQNAGMEVVIAAVKVLPPGVWVAVREVVGNDLGNVLGAARVGAPRERVVVPLLRGTESGRTYAIELYRDDNEGAFDITKNSVYVDFDTGTRVVVHFTTFK